MASKTFWYRPSKLLGKYLAVDLFDPKTGLITHEAGHELTEEDLETIEEAGIKELPLLAIDGTPMSAAMSATRCSLINVTRAKKRSSTSTALCAR